MKNVITAVTDVCTVAVIAAIIRVVLPRGSLGKLMSAVCNLVIAAAVVTSAISLTGADLSNLFTYENQEYDFSNDYVEKRIAGRISDDIQAQIEKTLSDFGITNGQISIEFDRGSYGNLKLEHISVKLPKGNSQYVMSIKQLLNDKFDVYCDVYESGDD